MSMDFTHFAGSDRSDYSGIVESVASLVSSVSRLSSENRTLTDRCSVLETEAEDRRIHSCDCRRFYNCALNTGVVADLHSVSKALVRKYVKLGLIPTHPSSSDGKIMIRASDALTLDFSELKRRMLYGQR